MIIWTSSISIFLFRYIFKDYAADLRFIILGSLYPLILDSLSYNFGISNKTQFLGHSLLFNVSLFNNPSVGLMPIPSCEAIKFK